MSNVTARGRPPQSSSASRQVSNSRRNSPWESSQRPAKPQEGQPKHQKPHELLSRLLDHGESPSQAIAPTADQLDAEVRAEEAEDESLDHVIMAIDNRDRDTIGCAYYIARQQILMCMEDVTGGGKEVLDKLKIDIQPTILLVSPRIDLEDEKEDARQCARYASVLDNDENPLPYRLEFRPTPEFGYDAALSKLANLQAFCDTEADLQFLVPGETSNFEPSKNPDDFGTTNRQGRLLQISACVDMESKISIGCLGAVITWLQRKRASEYLPDDPAADFAYRVLEVKMFSLQGTMLINPDTFVSLQIIQPESHPNAFNQGPGTSGSKESLSIYGLFHHLARTPQGKSRLREYFLRPSLDLAGINARLDFASVFVQPQNSITLNKLSSSLSRIKNMRTTMAMLHKGVNGGRKIGGFKSGVWASLLEFCYHAIDIAETLKEVLGAENIPLRAKAMDVLDAFQLQRIGKMVHDVVDLEASIEQHRTVAKRGIDEKLDEIKDVYDGMEELLSRVAIEIGRRLPAYVKLNVIYFPQLGFHITVPMNEDTGQAVYDGGAEKWQCMFTTQNQVYFKDARMHEMDEQLGDLYAMICDIEIEIAYELAQKVRQDERLLIAGSDICGELDALLALAHGAVQYKLVRPRITDDNVIDIKAGRHLLQEICVASYVPNDTFIVAANGQAAPTYSKSTQERPIGPSMLLLTGPNYSGKSVYMRSIALIVYMAHVGCFVPCTSASIGLTDKILTRITTRETVSRNQSAFMIELQQVAMAIKQCTCRSLIVIDEFGQDTESCDGAGLASGVIRYLLSMTDLDRPKCLVATHFHEIFEVDDGQPKLENYPNLGLRHMEVLLDHKQQREMGQHDSEVTYLYNLIEGRSSLSYGTQCAAMNGIPPHIVRRAAQLVDLSIKGEDLVRVCAAITDEEEKEFEEAEDAARNFLMMDLNEGREKSLVESLSSILADETDSAESGEHRSARSDIVSRFTSES